MIGSYIDAVTKLLAIRNVSDLPKWAIALGIGGSLLWLAARSRDAMNEARRIQERDSDGY
ncbi:hypothetical protein [Tateyamaria sp.]|uniref:hypothetical protein n=1 Tax=Tateyamaria sp. TaxID=1929288 RepID=UPI003B226783